MKNTNKASRWVNQLIAVLFLLSSPLAGAYAACCSGHGGVASCNKATGFQMCKDGTASPTCKCKKEKSTTTTTTKPKTTKKATTTTTSTTTNTTTTTTKPKTHWWNKKSTTTQPTTTKSTTTNGTNNKGCCSKHGGVGQCNKSTGYLTCKDGSQSPTCACH
ncbi:Uncharacterised protein [Legionella steigerwaltii]|uniref:Neurogenic locus notch like protein n=1 Tax=Legionella steigerwaltii TaxID=460 RepID=A0A378L664_9GAMM|nr:hypothetical protein [Legionella steigerwaltii]KTD80605.1 hypothetical protein Lstg_0441 [Legionella steigerwaltii]STY22555.1 Uncharacterised protein [Legionella steigerwaltii]